MLVRSITHRRFRSCLDERAVACERQFILFCTHAYAPTARSGIDGEDISALWVHLQNVLHFFEASVWQATLSDSRCGY